MSLKTPTDPKCRFYDPFNETIKHLVAGCKLFTLEKYETRQERRGHYLHWAIGKQYKISTEGKTYTYVHNYVNIKE